ncbi:hypothetical protein GCM10022384_45990 [Streptomyces marokkonensis]|uniref:Uncharacterized protein n=1 Tax=Streptomyces marokkonensis TaxID=324855 RepID=A0ABP7R7N9_9ACTN
MPECPGGGSADATRIQLWTCNDTGARKWAEHADGTVRNATPSGPAFVRDGRADPLATDRFARPFHTDGPRPQPTAQAALPAHIR